MRTNHEIGCIFDTLAFLSSYINETVVSGYHFQKISYHYNDAKQFIQKKDVHIHRYLYPFFFSRDNADSFLQTVIFSDEYSKCTFDRLSYTLRNKLYIKRSFVSYYIPDINDNAINNVLSMENPDVIDVLIQRSPDHVLDTYFFYILKNFDKVIDALHDLVIAVYKKIQEFRDFILSDIYTTFLKNDWVFQKLKAITGLNSPNENTLTVSVSFMAADKILYHANEQDFVLLGYDYEKKLDTEYKYCDVDLFQFANAIGSNPTKYNIFNALLDNPPMTTAELSVHLGLSRNELSYNLKELQDKRIVVSEAINKRTKKYRLDNQYLLIVLQRLNISVHKRHDMKTITEM